MTFLGQDQLTQQAVSLDNKARTQGLYVVGLTGTGKTTLLLNMIVQDMIAGHGIGVLDPHGDLVRDILQRVPPEREGDVILLDPTDYEYPFGLNLFECSEPYHPITSHQTYSNVMHVFDKLWGPEGLYPSTAILLTEILANATITLIQNQGFTMVELPKLLEDEQFRAKLVANVTNQEVIDYWVQQYNPLKPADQLERRESTVRRVREFLRQPIIRNIVGQSHTTVDFGAVMDEGKILLAPLYLRPMGEATVTLLGSILISQLLDAALSRRENRRDFYLYADEYWRFAISDFATLIGEARKFGVSTTIAHQFLDQLDKLNQGAVKSTVNRVVFQLNPDDADDLAGVFDHKPPQPEVVGQRPIQIISPHPVDVLLRLGHPDEYVKNFIETTLRPIQERKEMTDRHKDNIHEKAHREYLVAALGGINDYFVQVMRGSLVIGSDQEVDVLRSILNNLLGYFGFQADYGLHHPLVPREDKIFGRRHRPLGFEDYEINWHAPEQAVIKPRSLNQDTPLGQQLQQLVETGHSPELPEIISNTITPIRDFASYLRTNPIMTNSASFEPIYDRPRTFNDMHGEISNALATLPNHHARCRLGHAEHAIRTNRPPPELGGISERIERIRKNSRGNYAKRRIDVQVEIEARMETQQIPPPPERKTRRTRRTSSSGNQTPPLPQG